MLSRKCAQQLACGNGALPADSLSRDSSAPDDRPDFSLDALGARQDSVSRAILDAQSSGACARAAGSAFRARGYRVGCGTAGASTRRHPQPDRGAGAPGSAHAAFCARGRAGAASARGDGGRPHGRRPSAGGWQWHADGRARLGLGARRVPCAGRRCARAEQMVAPRAAVSAVPHCRRRVARRNRAASGVHRFARFGRKSAVGRTDLGRAAACGPSQGSICLYG